MSMAAITGLIALPILLLSVLLPVALVVALQVWLCKRKTRWLGLILPVLSFLFSLLLVFSIGAFGLIQTGSGGSMTLDENGQVVQQTITENGMITTYDGEGNIIEQHPDPDAQEKQAAQEEIFRHLLPSAVLLFLVGNIPTVVLGGIWLHYKNRRDFQDEIKKMNIQDLG